ncbi:MAG: ATP-binding protein [Candidatus Pseudobacter hemicellulosilyticus]|uniref:ATP-binding protein n=1 Tax=Candidatus Pseudobacter hemicellulosilyticus TaxID=3121375 RepID=A0AAJ6BEM1_9BACT|nr:MAG: ATP-binding protein [Pseudobacter sp.]
MAKENGDFDPRKYMELAINVMNQSIQEPRQDKTSPKVGAVLIKSNGQEETAFRGELRHGDHAEFTLLERKNRSVSLEGAILFATLEPCAPGARKHPKLGCAERIVNARIKKVWIGIEDPDPTVDRKGIKYLLDHGIEVNLFDADLQEQIRQANKQFIEEAEERAKKAKIETQPLFLSEKEKVETKADTEDLSKDVIEDFISKANLNVKIDTLEYYRILAQIGILELKNDGYIPTGLGLLLFGKRPQLVYQNALIRATFKTSGRGEDIETIEGPLVSQADKVQSWYENHIGKQIDRTSVERRVIHDYPLVVFREAIINAIVHRDYDIDGAPIYFEINDEAIVIKSPGKPVEPLTLEQIKKFNAPSLSRNPKIMYVFDQMELVEQRGLGFQTIKDLPQKHNLPLPLVTYEAPYMVFSFPRNIEAVKKVSTNPNIAQLTDAQIQGYEWLKLVGQASTREYSSHFNISYKTAQRHLAAMKALDLLGDNGEESNSPNYEYIVNE